MTTNGSNERSKETRKVRDLARDHDRVLMARARSIASEYTILLQPHERMGFMGSSLEFPTVFTHGRTSELCIKNTREALAIGVYVMLEAGDTPPVAATEKKRDQQINIRLTVEERSILESAAKRRGFRGISDFVRTAAMNQTRRSA